jgi:hypothetical protein
MFCVYYPQQQMKEDLMGGLYAVHDVNRKILRNVAGKSQETTYEG